MVGSVHFFGDPMWEQQDSQNKKLDIFGVSKSYRA
jgi:hypothetical protein